MTDRLAADLRWFLDRQDRAPERIHERGVWRVPEETEQDPETGLRRPTLDSGLGSILGSPEDSRDFRDWLERGEWAWVTENVQSPCPHPMLTARDRSAGKLCATCGIQDKDGRLISETGMIRRRVKRYRWPMRAAMSKARGVTVKRGRPDLAMTLRALGRSRGDVAGAIAALAVTHPIMGDPALALQHVAFALRVCRQRFREDAPVRAPADRSQAQLDAERASTESGPPVR
jgi:hypothetical protein